MEARACALCRCEQQSKMGRNGLMGWSNTELRACPCAMQKLKLVGVSAGRAGAWRTMERERDKKREREKERERGVL